MTETVIVNDPPQCEYTETVPWQRTVVYLPINPRFTKFIIDLACVPEPQGAPRSLKIVGADYYAISDMGSNFNGPGKRAQLSVP